jgi:class 3 adenylate cyclase
VWDSRENRLQSQTAAIISQWHDTERLHVIKIDKLMTGGNLVEPLSGAKPRVGDDDASMESIPWPCGKRVMKVMLFADVVGSAQTSEELMPAFVHECLKHIASHLKEIREETDFINSWGDAIFVVMSEVGAIKLTEYAQKVVETVNNTDWQKAGLPPGLSIRIALHAGPVFQATDPVTGRTNFYGSHVNRAARIESITRPGSVYASEQFAALLTTLQNEAEHTSCTGTQKSSRRFACDYVGVLELSKRAGKQAIYRVRRLNINE